MASPVLDLIRKARASLGAAQVAWGAAGWVAVAAPAAALPSFLLHRLGLLGAQAALAAWALLVLAAASAGAYRAFRRRIGLEAAALWLDRALGDGELLSAALACMGRERPGRFDAAVLERAEALALESGSPRPSAAPLVARSAIALAACLAASLGLYLAFAEGPGKGGARARGGSPSPAAKGIAGLAGGDARPTPKEAARALFPGDERLAALAEASLREGRLEDLRDLVAKADKGIAQRLGRASEAGSRNRLEAERERLKAAARAAAEGFAPQGEGRGEGGEGPGQGGRDEADGGAEGAMPESRGELPAPGRPPSSGGGEAPPEEGEGGGNRGRPGVEFPGEPRKGGSLPGSGAGARRSWGRIDPAEGGPEAVLPDDPRSSLFDSLLPGTEPSARLADRVEAAARAAEAAAAREQLPWEHRDFLESYFLSLSRAAAKADRERGALGGEK